MTLAGVLRSYWLAAILPTTFPISSRKIPVAKIAAKSRPNWKRCEDTLFLIVDIWRMNEWSLPLGIFLLRELCFRRYWYNGSSRSTSFAVDFRLRTFCGMFRSGFWEWRTFLVRKRARKSWLRQVHERRNFDSYSNCVVHGRIKTIKAGVGPRRP